MQAELKKSNIEIDHELSDDFSRILGSAQNITPFESILAGAKKAAILDKKC